MAELDKTSTKRAQRHRKHVAFGLCRFPTSQALDRIGTESPILRVGYLPRPVETFVGLHWPVEICGYSGQRLVSGGVVVVGQVVGLKFYW